MKKHTEYKLLLRLEVAEIGERDGWPVEGLVVSNDGKNWHNAGGIKAIGEDCETTYHGLWNYCARPVEHIEWELGDTVQWAYIKGWIEKLLPTHVRIVNAAPCANKHLIAKSEIQPWTPGYRYTVEGELIIPPTGYEIVLEGEPLPNGYLAYIHGDWLAGKNYVGERAETRGDCNVRAYARKIESDPIAEGHNPEGLTVSQIGKGWRLLSRDEIAEREPTEKIQAWLRSRNSWSGLSIYRGSEATMTYRTQQPEGYFLPEEKEIPKAGQIWRQVSSDVEYMIISEDGMGKNLCGNGQWNLDFIKSARFIASDMQLRDWVKVADSLKEYYAAKQQPAAITQDSLIKYLKKWENELEKYKHKAKELQQKYPNIAEMWWNSADLIEDILGELNDALNEDIEQQKGK